MARDHREVVEGALALKKAGNTLMRIVGGREIHPVNVRVGGVYRAPSRAELAPAVAALEAVREFARTAIAWTAALPFPDFEEDFEFVALRGGGRLRDRARPARLQRRTRSRPRRVRDALRRGARRRTRPRCTRCCATAAGATSSGRSPAGRSTATRCPRDVAGRSRRRRPGSGLPQPVPQHRRARRRDPLRRRRGAAAARRLHAAGGAGGRRCRRAPAPAAAGRRRRAGCSGTATRSTPRARSSMPGSSRRRPRTRPGSSRACAAFVERHLALDDAELQHRCEQAVRSYDPCISCATHFLRLTIDRG